MLLSSWEWEALVRGDLLQYQRRWFQDLICTMSFTMRLLLLEHLGHVAAHLPGLFQRGELRHLRREIRVRLRVQGILVLQLHRQHLEEVLLFEGLLERPGDALPDLR